MAIGGLHVIEGDFFYLPYISRGTAFFFGVKIVVPAHRTA